jgi:hypothetical protein
MFKETDKLFGFLDDDEAFLAALVLPSQRLVTPAQYTSFPTKTKECIQGRWRSKAWTDQLGAVSHKLTKLPRP